MDVDQFWQLNDGLPAEGAEEALAQRLSELDPSEIESYQKHFDTTFAEAYQWLLWGAAYIIDGGCSDDGFIDFRYGLISRGRKVFEAALVDPDSLVDVASDSDEGYIPNELFGYVAQEVYETKVGERMPRNSLPQPTEPDGDDWDFDDAEVCAQRLPKLWAKFGD